MPRSRSPSPRRRGSPPRRRSFSPRRRSPRRSNLRRRSRSRSGSPRRSPPRRSGGRKRSRSRSRSRSPRRSTGRRRSPSPRQRTRSPRRRSPSPKRQSPSPRRRSPSPRRRSPSSRRRSASPTRKSPSPRQKSRSPRRVPRNVERPLVREAESTVKEDRGRERKLGGGGRSSDRLAREKRSPSHDRSPLLRRSRSNSPKPMGDRSRSPSPYGQHSPSPGPAPRQRPGGYSPPRDMDHRRDRYGQSDRHNYPGDQRSGDKDYRNLDPYKEPPPQKRFDQTEVLLHERITSYGDDLVNFLPEDIITIGIERNILGNEVADVDRPYNSEEVIVVRRKEEGEKPLHQRDEFLGPVEDEYNERRIIKVVGQQRRKSPEVRRRDNFEVRRDRFQSANFDAKVSLSDRWGHEDIPIVPSASRDKVEFIRRDDISRSSRFQGSSRFPGGYDSTVVVTRGDTDARVVLDKSSAEGGDFRSEDLRFRLKGDKKLGERGHEKFVTDPNDLRHSLGKRKTISDARSKILERRRDDARGITREEARGIAREDARGIAREDARGIAREDARGIAREEARGGARERRDSKDELPDFSKRPDKYKFEEWKEKPDMVPKGSSYFEHDNRGADDDFFDRRGRGFRGRGFRGRGYRGRGRGFTPMGRGRYRRESCSDCESEGCDNCIVSGSEAEGLGLGGEEESLESDQSSPKSMIREDEDWDYDDIMEDDIGNARYGMDVDEDLDAAQDHYRSYTSDRSTGSPDRREYYQDQEMSRPMKRREEQTGDLCFGCQQYTNHKFGHKSCPAALKPGDVEMAVFANHIDPKSNYHKALLDVFGHHFYSVHQAWLWKKAMDLGMNNFAGQLKDAKHAGEAAKFAKQLEEDDQWNEWDDSHLDIMKDLLRLKAEQYPRFKGSLIRTGGKVIAAALIDKYWGTGMSTMCTSKTKPEYWPGKNKLGEMLMVIRLELMEREQHESDVQPETSSLKRKRSESPVGQRLPAGQGRLPVRRKSVERKPSTDLRQSTERRHSSTRSVSPDSRTHPTKKLHGGRCKICLERGHTAGDPGCKAENKGQEKNCILRFQDKTSLSPMQPCHLKCYGIVFKSALQAWLWKKATLLGYHKLANFVLDAKSAGSAMKKAQELNATPARRSKWIAWDEDHYHIWEEVLNMQADQNKQFCKDLLNTEGVIGFADVMQKNWGTGLTKAQSKKTLSKFWPQNNVIGSMLGELRKELQEDKPKKAKAPAEKPPGVDRSKCSDCKGLAHRKDEKCPALNEGSEKVTTVTWSQGIMSNYFALPVSVFGHYFHSAHQAFMWKKASSFGLVTLANMIINAKEATKAQALVNGNKEKNQVGWDDWDKDNVAVMKLILTKKAEKHAPFQEALARCQGTIAMCSPDVFWGTGLHRNFTEKLLPTFWPGENMFGKLLMELRGSPVKCRICGQEGHSSGNKKCPALCTSKPENTTIFQNKDRWQDNFLPLSMYHKGSFDVFGQHFSTIFQAWIWKKSVMLGLVRLSNQVKHADNVDEIIEQIADMKLLDNPRLNWQAWDMDNPQHMTTILKAKANQNKDFCNALKVSRQNTIVLAGEDNLWETGLSKVDTKRTLPEYWPGKNVYGKLLTDICEDAIKCKICQQSGHIDGDKECPAFNDGEVNMTVVYDCHNVLSNFHSSSVDVYSQTFPSAHQAWLWKKASSVSMFRLANQVKMAETAQDAELLIEELNLAEDPTINWEGWDKDNVAVMKLILTSKATKNQVFKSQLGNCKDVIAFALPDKFWGTGITQHLTMKTLPDFWPGKNMLGNLMMEVRKEVLLCRVCGATGHQERSNTCPAANKEQLALNLFVHHTNVLSNFHSGKIDIFSHMFGGAYLAFLWKKSSSLGLHRLAAKLKAARHPGEVRITLENFERNIDHEIKQSWFKWDKDNVDVMRSILRAKVKQQEEFCKDILSSEGVFAYTTGDLLWGTGLPRERTREVLPAFWPGKNMLGVLLQELKDDLAKCKICKQAGHDLGSKDCPGLNQGQVPITVISHHQHALSNWFKYPFEAFGNTFNSAEQAWLWKKATSLDKADLAKKILESSSAAGAHKLVDERSVTSDEKWQSWDKANVSLMKEILELKAAQCDQFRKRLKEVDSLLACAIPCTPDTFWGTGLARVETRRTLPKYWLGENRMGQLLTEIRKQLLLPTI